MKETKAEIIKKLGNLGIAKVYANKEKEEEYYGDIFNTKEEVLEYHPNAHILEGYIVIDLETGSCHDDSKDWYYSVEEAETDVLNLASI